MDAGSEIRDSIVNGENCKIGVCWLLVARCRRFGGFQCLEIYSPHPSYKPKPISQFSQFSLPRDTQPKPQPQTLTVFIVFTTGQVHSPHSRNQATSPNNLNIYPIFMVESSPPISKSSFTIFTRGRQHTPQGLAQNNPNHFHIVSKFSI